MTLPHSSRAGAPLVNAEGEEVTKDPSHFKGPMLPVDTVSWHDVQLFLARMNVRDPKFQYRLPTEAEWEYACRAGNQEEGLANLGAIAWYKANSEEHTHPVGGKQPNAWGLFDTHGNVSEWVHDWYGPDYYEGSPLADPPGPRTGSYRVFRGGSWLDAEKNCRASFRGFDLPINRAYNVGFRVVRTPAA